MNEESQTSPPLTHGEITELLSTWNQGERQVMAEILPKVYQELRDLAIHYMQGESGQHTLQPTALIHEVYIRLIDHQPIHFANRLHFFWFAGQLMRRILVDYGRKKMSDKRGNGKIPEVFDDHFGGTLNLDPSLLVALDNALKKLQVLDQRQCNVVELKFFCGLKVEEIGELLNLSPTSVKRDWRTAKRWLARELRGMSTNDPSLLSS